MSLHPQAFCPIPEETVHVARAAYPKGNVYMQVRDELGSIYDDQSAGPFISQLWTISGSTMAFTPGKPHAVCRRTF